MLTHIITNVHLLAKQYKSATLELTQLIMDIYENTKFNGININDKPYYEITNKWSNSRFNNDENTGVVCSGYWQHEWSIKRIKKLKTSDKYEFIIDYGPYKDKLK